MTEIQVELGERSYPILIGSDLIDRLGALLAARLPKANRALLITDTHVSPIYARRVTGALTSAGIQVAQATVEAGEASKSLETAAQLYRSCAAAMLERSSVIVALGGGVIGDLAGFVAATYLRGLPFVQVPTSLLAQVDSSVGGKTGVDLPEGKNLVGAFHQPSLVVADLQTLRTLPPREVAAGMTEVIKHAIIRDADFLTYLEQRLADIQALQPAVMAEVVARNCRIKAAVVSADEREGGLRAILNLGHTVGHAVEAFMGFGGWLHGECVAVGMVFATALAQEVGLLQEPDLLERLAHLLRRLNLPVHLPADVTLEALQPLMERDKKVASGRVRWVLPIRAGEVQVTDDVALVAIEKAMQRVRG